MIQQAALEPPTIASNPYAVRPPRPEPSPAREPIEDNWELFSAQRTLQRGEGFSAPAHRLREGWQPIIEALGLPEDQNPAWFHDLDAPEMRRTPILTRSVLRSPRTAARGEPAIGEHMVGRAEQEERLLAAIRGRRLREPGFLAGVPDTIEGLRGFFREQERRRRDTARDTLSRGGPGWMPWLAATAGSLVEGAIDPPNLAMSLIPTGAGATVLRTFGREFLLNSAIELVQQPMIAQRRTELGEDFTLGEAGTNVFTAGVAGGVLGTGVEYGMRGLGRAIDGARGGEAGDLGRTLESVLRQAGFDQTRIDRLAVSLQSPGGGIDAGLDLLGRLPDEDLAELVRGLVTARGEGVDMTPDERAAINVVEREAELAAASPFEPGPEGDTAHHGALAEGLRALINSDSPAPAVRPPGPPPVARGTAAPRVPAFAGPAPAFDVQWRTIIGIEEGTDRQGRFRTSPAGAIGPAQVMPGTAPYAARLAGLPFDNHRYRTDAAYNVALGQAYYRQMLREFGGDPSMAAAAYNAGPGSARTGRGVRGALERARRAGEPDNWEAYLPRETRLYVANFRRRTGAGDGGAPPVRIAEGEAAPAARADGEAAALDAEALALSRQLEEADIPVSGREAPFEPVPALRRDLFESDAAWAAAQEQVWREANDVEDLADISTPARQGEAPGAETAAAAPTQRGAPGEAERGPAAASELDRAELAALRAYVAGRGKLDRATIARRLGITPERADRLTGILSSSPGSGVTLSRSGKLRRTAVARGPVDAIRFLRNAGGVTPTGARPGASSRGHGLTRGRNWHLAAPGLVNRKGMTIDEAGEALWEAGYFHDRDSLTGDRPTEAEVLEFIETALATPAWRREDLDVVAQREADAEWRQAQAAARGEIDTLARARDLDLNDAELADAVDYMMAGDEPAAALQRALDDASARTYYRAADETGDEFYDEITEDIYAGDIAEPRDRGLEDAGGRQEGDEGDPGGRGTARSQPGEDGESLAAFDTPEAEGPRAQIDSIEHDLRMQLAGEGAGKRFVVDEAGPRALSDIIAELDAEAAGARALGECLKPGGEA